MTEIFLKKTLSGLAPIDEAGAEALQKIRLNNTVKCKITTPRNVEHSAKFWKLMDVIFQNQEYYHTRDQMIFAIKDYLGYVEWFSLKSGKQASLEQSLAFHKMSQIEFNGFYDRVLDVIAKHIIPGIDSGELRREVEGFL